jgi:hypothetical protein
MITRNELLSAVPEEHRVWASRYLGEYVDHAGAPASVSEFLGALADAAEDEMRRAMQRWMAYKDANVDAGYNEADEWMEAMHREGMVMLRK